MRLGLVKILWNQMGSCKNIVRQSFCAETTYAHSTRNKNTDCRTFQAVSFYSYRICKQISNMLFNQVSISLHVNRAESKTKNSVFEAMVVFFSLIRLQCFGFAHFSLPAEVQSDTCGNELASTCFYLQKRFMYQQYQKSENFIHLRTIKQEIFY